MFQKISPLSFQKGNKFHFLKSISLINTTFFLTTQNHFNPYQSLSNKIIPKGSSLTL